MIIEPQSTWMQMPAESDSEYAWFKTYLELGDMRTLPKTARRTGTTIKKIEEAASSFNWSQRQFDWTRDSRQIAKTQIRDEEAVHSVEYQVGIALIRLGISGLDAKNPALIDVKGLTALIKEGTDLARKGSGAADMVIEVTDRRQIQSAFADFLGEEVEEIE